MNSRHDAFLTRLTFLSAVAATAMTLAGCASDGGDSSYSGVSTSVSVGYGYGGYYGGGYYPGYYPGGYPPVVVVPPRPERPVRPVRPDVRPMPVPSRPTRPMPRGGGGGRRG